MEQREFRQALRNFLHNRPGLRALFYTSLEALVVSFWHIRKELWRIAIAQGRRNLHVLDAGSGMGQYEHFMSSRFPSWNICALDRDEVEVGECNRYFVERKKYRVYFKKADLNEFRQANCFDLVLSVNVLEYMPDDHKILRNFYESLRPEGNLLLAVQSDKALHVQPNFTNKLLGNQEALHRYNVLGLKKLLKEMGFVKIKAHYAYGYSGRLSTRLGVRIPKYLLKQSRDWIWVLPLYYLLTYPLILLLNFLDVLFAHWRGSELIVRAVKP
ncbi:MAG: class I SAM-dependent methyltransferase [Bacteroidota bacterium]